MSLMIDYIIIFLYFVLAVALVGGSGPFEGYLYATNPVTKTYGPVCDDYFTLGAVSIYG